MLKGDEKRRKQNTEKETAQGPEALGTRGPSDLSLQRDLASLQSQLQLRPNKDQSWTTRFQSIVTTGKVFIHQKSVFLLNVVLSSVKVSLILNPKGW